jgi:hypothetical protein
MVRLGKPFTPFLSFHPSCFSFKLFTFMKKELVAIALISLAFSTGMVLTAVTSGCDAHRTGTAQAPAVGVDSTSDNPVQ